MRLWCAAVLLGGCDRVLGLDTVTVSDAAVDAGLSAYGMIVVGDQPVAYWPLDDLPGATTIREVMNVAPGLVAGSCVLGVPGAMANDTAIGFDGITCFIDVGDHQRLQFAGTQPYTLEAWVSSMASTGTFFHIFTRERRGGNGPQDGYAMLLRSPTTVFNERTVANANITTQPDATITSQMWHHLVATYDGAVLLQYVDGGAISQSMGTTAMMPAFTKSAYIGASGDGTSLFAGVIDEVAVYDHALMPDRIAAHYATR